MKLNKRLITGIAGGILAVAVIAILSAAGARKKAVAQLDTAAKMAQKNAPRPVRFEKVKAQSRGKQRSYPGLVRASEETALSFRVGGPLTEVNVKLGEPLKKGDLLMQIDPRDYEDRILSLEAQLLGAVALQENAKQDFLRIAGLFEEKVVPQSDFDRSKSILDSSASRVKGLNAQVQIARHALEDTSLRAPYDGTVTEQKVENHEMINPGDVVMQYHNIQTLEIIVNIPENEVANAPMHAEGIRVEVSFPALQGETFKASLKEWSTRADELTRTYAATFELTAPAGGRILPGMTANVDFLNAHDQAIVLTVPVSALVSDPDGGNSVWVYDDAQGVAALRSVLPGGLQGASRIVITEGLSEGELVVVTGSRLIHGTLPLKTASAR